TCVLSLLEFGKQGLRARPGGIHSLGHYVFLASASLAKVSAIGTVNVKADPSPSRLSTLTCPPWASTSRLTKASPRPVPPPGLAPTCTKRPKSVGRYSWGIPSPESLTLKKILPLRSDAEMVTRPLWPVCRIAFDNRLSRIRLTASLSAMTRGRSGHTWTSSSTCLHSAEGR